MTNKPQPVSQKEWLEIVKVTEVREGWGVEDAEGEELLKENVYAAKFDYVSDGPGYAGEIFFLWGGVPENPPITLLRGEDGVLKAVDTTNR